MSPISRCQITRFRLPLRQPITIAKTQVSCRQGALIRITFDDGRSGAGEITPLPGLHTQTLEDLAPILSHLAATLPKLDPCETPREARQQSARHLPDLPPVVRNGIEMAFWNVPASESLQPHTPSPPASHAPESIPVCALVTDQADRPTACTRLIEEGFNTLKIKVGRHPLEADLRFLAELGRWCTANNQSPILRLDANRAWTFDQARHVYQFLGELPLQLDYIEEPLQDADRLPELVRQTGMPVGVDEALAHANPDDAPFWSFVKAVIIKPAVIGGFACADQWIQAAQARQINPVLSSCFETGLAVVSYAALAASHNLHHIAHGLDTLKFLAQDLPDPRPAVVRGALSLQCRPLNPGRLQHRLLSS